MSDSNAIIDLQMLVMEQEQSIETLSQQLLSQADSINKLTKQVSILELKLTQLQQLQAESMSEALPVHSQNQDEKPPHY